MWQPGQVFKLKAKGADGQPLWAYRYRLERRGSARPHVGGYPTRAEAQEALRKVLQRRGPGDGRRRSRPAGLHRCSIRAGGGEWPTLLVSELAVP
jgi:hypothetical protein